jgi:hypothetical protein
MLHGRHQCAMPHELSNVLKIRLLLEIQVLAEGRVPGISESLRNAVVKLIMATFCTHSVLRL